MILTLKKKNSKKEEEGELKTLIRTKTSTNTE